MGSSTMKDFLTSIRLTIVLQLLCCVAYPAVVWGVGQAAFRHQADGSLIEHDGKIVGSDLVGQAFSSPRYFLGRPSAVAYNAAGSGGSNYGPTNPALLARMADAVTSASELDGLSTSTIAADRAFASGSGLDPDITPENAAQQVARVARERGIAPETVRALVAKASRPPLFGFLGPPRVNVLSLNLALDDSTASRGH